MNDPSDSLLLEHDGLRVSVRAPPADAAWLADFVSPGFARGAGGSGIEVSFEKSLEETSSRGERAELRVAFVLDTAPVRLSVWSTPRARYAAEPNAGIAYHVSTDGAVARVRYSGDRGAARVRLLRVVREYAHNHSLATSGLVLHAAGVATQDGAVLLAGGKGAGKTTTTLRLLASGDAAFLANDRVLLRVASGGDGTRGGEIRARAVPTVIALRAPTLALFPDVAARIGRCGDFHDAAAERRPGAPATVGDTVRVSSPQLCDALGCRAVAEARVGAILFIDRQSPAAGDRRESAGARRPPADGGLRRLGISEATDALAASLVGAASGTYASELFVTDRRSPTSAELRNGCAVIAAAVACYAGAPPGRPAATGAAALLGQLVSGPT